MTVSCVVLYRSPANRNSGRLQREVNGLIVKGKKENLVEIARASVDWGRYGRREGEVRGWCSARIRVSLFLWSKVEVRVALGRG